MPRDELLHIRVGRQLKREIDQLIDSGLFSSQTELAREAIRSLILKYKEQIKIEQKQVEEK